MESVIIALSFVILIFSVILHEVAHGFVALLFGDHTAERAGRLTLNPLPHIDLIGTILIPALFILPALAGRPTGFIVGWAKPVPVNPLNFSDMKKGELAVSLAGVGSNFALAIIAAILFHLVSPFASFIITSILVFTVNINLLLGIFNLIPVPPLDGSKVLMAFLPLNLAMEYQRIERYGLIILIALWFIPFGNSTVLGIILGFFLNIFHAILGV